MDENSETPAEHLPPVEPESSENLAFHLGKLSSEHKAIQGEWSEHKAEMASLRELVLELQQALTTVEAEAEQIMEEGPSEAVLDGEADHPALETSPSKKPNWLVRSLTGQ